MGLLDKRKRKIAENAAEFLEPGESIQAMVMTQTGESAGALATKVASHNARIEATGVAVGAPTTIAAVHALAATERNVYAFSIPALTSVGGVALKAPIGEADIALHGKKKVVFAGVEFHVLFFANKDARALLDFVESRR